MRGIVSALVVVGCGSAPSTNPGDDVIDPEEPAPLAFETYSPPQSTSYDIFVAARGQIVVLANRMSKDGGATWQPSPVAQAASIAIHDNVITAFAGGLVRYDVTTQQTSPITAPAYASAGTWRTTPAGKLVVFHPIQNAIALETAAGFTAVTLPQPTPTEFDPYITDIESNGSTLLVVSGWGIHRSTDGGASFERIAPAALTMGRELVVLANQRFALLGGSITSRFDATGAPISESTGITVGTQEARACEDGALLVRDQISHDAGDTWQPFIPDAALALTVERFGCGGGDYWLLGHSDTWGYRLLRYADASSEGIVFGNWELDGDIAWSSAGPPALRTNDSFISAGLAWTVGDSSWSVREIPTKAWSIGNALFGVSDNKFFTSTDAGRTWQVTNTTGLDGEIEAFARGSDDAFYASRFTTASTEGTDEWHARVWRSTDGASWSLAYEGRATREPGKNTVGEAHRFVAITPTGTWIATDAISNDSGVTWQANEQLGDRSLAFVTPSGHLVTSGNDLWHVLESNGSGKLVRTWRLEARGEVVPASDIRSVAFDDAGYAYVARGTPYVQLWRSVEPLVGD